jgi:hypothetical protein
MWLCEFKKNQEPMNSFVPKSAAERYAKGHLYFYPPVVSRRKAYLSLAEPVACALQGGYGADSSGVRYTPIKAEGNLL